MCMFTAKRSASVVHSFNIGTRKPLNSITVQAKMHDAMNSIYIPLKCFFFEHCQEHWPACKNSCWAPTLTVRSTQMGCREVRGRAYRGSHTHTHLYTRTHPGTPLEKSPVRHQVEPRRDLNRGGQLGHWS